MKMFISSADFMTRNLNRRVEVACPVRDSSIRVQIMDILELMLQDNVKARKLRFDGIYEKKDAGGQPVDCQQELINRAMIREVEAVNTPDRHQKGQEEKSESLWQKLRRLF